MNITTQVSLLLSLGAAVKTQRTKLKLSQEQLADICGFDRTYISLIERGKRNISFSNLHRLSQGLKTTVSELTEGI
jgi:transcriptional regulator with XRE-family HTH domain